MRKLGIIVMLLGASSAYCQDMDYWEQVLKTSLDSQINASLANFQMLPVDVEPSSSFGMRRHPISNLNKMHKGIDLPAAEGTPFKAVAPGVVIFSGEWGGLGNLIVIDHGDGLVTRYGHAQTLILEKGDIVRRGDEIGTVGQTGMVTGPHVHFEILHNNSYLDPEAFIAQRSYIQVDELRKRMLEDTVDIDNYIDAMHKSRSERPGVASVPGKNGAGEAILTKVVNGDAAGDIKQPQGNIKSAIMANNDPLKLPTRTNSSVEPGPRYSDTIITKRTLWSLADEIRPDSATVFQSMIAIYNANPNAFPDNNVNKRWVEIEIHLPSAEEILAVNHKAARDKYYSDLAVLEDKAKAQLAVALSTSEPKNDKAPL